MPTYPKLEALIPVTNDMTIKITETTASATVTVLLADTTGFGGYFLTNSTATASAYLRAIQSALTANATLSGTYQLTVADSGLGASGVVTISATAGPASFSLVWSNTAYGSVIRAALGFSADLQAGSASYTGSYASKYIWLPNVARAEPEGPEVTASITTLGIEDSDLVVTQAPTGAAVVITYNRRQEARMTWRYLLSSKVHVITESTTNESLQTMWETMMDDGTMTFAYYPDRSVDTVSVALIAMAKRFEPIADLPGWTGAKSLWSFSWNCIKKI
mgnify:CR=1 FL=1